MSAFYAFDRDSGIGTIDCHYVKPRLACAYIMVEGNEVAFIENNTSLAHPLLMAALSELGLHREQVKHIIITHVHLDHAGGTGLLARECPGASVLVHPKAARHIVDPGRLIASSIGVYGEENFRQLYGDILPVAEDRIRIMQDNEVLQFGARSLRFLHTRGHANHHFCIHDSKSHGVFTGDSFGIAYPILQSTGPYIYPTSTPTDFDPAQAFATLDRIRATGCSRLFLTHFGEIRRVDEAERQMREGLVVLEGLLNEAMDSAESDSVLVTRLGAAILGWMEGHAAARSVPVSTEAREMMKLDADLNAQGIVVAAHRRRKADKDAER